MNHGFSIIYNRRVWYILSAILIIPGVIFLFWKGLNVGIDFKGGTVQRVLYTGTRPGIEAIRTRVEDSGVVGATVQTAGDTEALIRFPNQEGETARANGDRILTSLRADSAEVAEEGFENVGGSVAKSTTSRAVWAVIIASLAIILYIAWSFSSVPATTSSWRFGVSAIAALAHDILFVVGAFAILGAFIPSIEVDSLFITALLTILGFSVNDTIVVFDRIRENLKRNPKASFEETANQSLNQSLARSLNTSLAVLVVMITLLILGGAPIRNFMLALTLGVLIGTYSSVFNATPLLVSWQLWADRRAKLAGTMAPVGKAKR